MVFIMSKIQCLRCLEILESLYTHNFVQCACSNETFLDGGNSYMRVGGKDLSLIKVLNIPKEE